jgi:hypothetical protein
MEEQIMKIAMCWKCSNVNTVISEEDSLPDIKCSTPTGCKEMTQKEWDEAASKNPMGAIPSWEDCPLSK